MMDILIIMNSLRMILENNEIIQQKIYDSLDTITKYKLVSLIQFGIRKSILDNYYWYNTTKFEELTNLGIRSFVPKLFGTGKIYFDDNYQIMTNICRQFISHKDIVRTVVKSGPYIGWILHIVITCLEFDGSCNINITLGSPSFFSEYFLA